MSYNGHVVIDSDCHIREYWELDRTYKETMDPEYRGKYEWFSEAVRARQNKLGDVGFGQLFWPRQAARPLGLHETFELTDSELPLKDNPRPAPTVTGRGYDIDPSCNWDPSIRLRDMETAGVDVSFMFPSQADGFCMLGDVGFESQHMTVHNYQQVTEAVRSGCDGKQPSLKATAGIVDGLRTVKDTDELALLQRAIDVADGAMEAVRPTIQPGDTELQIAWRLEQTMRELGADGPSFDTIVAAGPNGAMPHHRPSDQPIAAGEPIVIDMGARVNGYCSDITRTICLGRPDDTFQRVYDIVLGAQLTAMNTVMPGMTGGEADGLSRGVISEAGYGESFGHSLGHGIGLAVHEYPRVGPNASNVLEEGMVFTIEPGIYLSGWGGVRIEDDVVLEAGGARPLSKASK